MTPALDNNYGFHLNFFRDMTEENKSENIKHKEERDHGDTEK